MKTLKISETKALELYKTASSEFKRLLEENFGKEFFIPKKITDRIKTLDDVYKYLNKKREKEISYLSPKNKQERSINAFIDIQNISEVLNEGWVPDFKNINQNKYYPYFEKKAQGWVVASCLSHFAASLGFGCYFKTSELATFAGRAFLDVYNDYLPE